MDRKQADQLCTVLRGMSPRAAGIFSHPIAAFVPSTEALALCLDASEVELVHPGARMIPGLDSKSLHYYISDIHGETFEFLPLDVEHILAWSLQSIVDDAYESHPDAGLSCGPHKLTVATDNYCDTAFIFHFGSYANKHVLAFGSIEDALEDAAAVVADKWPGMFTEWSEGDRAVAREELLADGELSADEAADLDSDEVADKVWEHLTTDHTCTESGYIASWEWTITEVRTLDDVLAFVTRERADNG